MAKEEQERIDRELEEMIREIKPIKEAAAKAAASTEGRPRLISLNMQVLNLYSTDPVKFGSPILGFPTKNRILLRSCGWIRRPFIASRSTR